MWRLLVSHLPWTGKTSQSSQSVGSVDHFHLISMDNRNAP
jgi:hypothetical protein